MVVNEFFLKYSEQKTTNRIHTRQRDFIVHSLLNLMLFVVRPVNPHPSSKSPSVYHTVFSNGRESFFEGLSSQLFESYFPLSLKTHCQIEGKTPSCFFFCQKNRQLRPQRRLGSVGGWRGSDPPSRVIWLAQPGGRLRTQGNCLVSPRVILREVIYA